MTLTPIARDRAVLTVIFVGIGVAVWLHRREALAPSAEEPRATSSQPIEHFAAVEPARTLCADLVEADWDLEAARNVADLSAGWFEMLCREKPGHAAKQIVLLKALGKHATIMDLLKTHPELAGLLAAAEDPLRLARTLNSGPEDDYHLIAGLYAQHAAPEDAARLSEALEQHRSLISRLLRKGLFGAEAVFIFPRINKSTEQYDRWLREQWHVHLGKCDEERAAFLHFVLLNGEDLRKKLEKEPLFAQKFAAELWPKLARIAEPGATWDLYAGEEHLWSLLALREGESLLRQHGRLPILLMFDEGAYPEEFHKGIIRALLNFDKDKNDQMLVEAMVQFRDEPLFKNLLLRELKDDLMASAARQLLGAGKQALAKLKLFETLNDADLNQELLGKPPEGLKAWIPLFQTYYLSKKLYQGRDPSNMEWFLAVAEPLTLLVPLPGLGGAIAKKGAQSVATTLGKRGIEQAEKQFLQQVTKAGGQLAIKSAPKGAVGLLENSAAGELAKWSVSVFLTKLQGPIRQALTKATTFEITQPVRFVFSYSPVGRESFKRLMGLEARLFMRGDARVFICVGKTSIGTLGSRIVNKINDDLANDLVGNFAQKNADEQEAIWQNSVAGWCQALENLCPDQLEQSWRKNVSAWWLMNASGLNVPARK